MRIILTSRKGVHYESARRGEATVLYVPGQDDPRVYRDLEGKSHREIATRYGANNRKPLSREYLGEIQVYGLLDEDIAERRHAIKAYLPQDFVPEDAHAFYMLLGKKYIVHGVRTITDEGEVRWGNSLITLQGGNPVKIITSAISERMLDGDAEGICVAVDGNLEVYEDLKKELQPFSIAPQPMSALTLNKKTLPLFAQRDFSLLMIFAVFLLMILCGAASFFWWVNKTRTDQLNLEMRTIRNQITQVQNNEKLGHILNPRAMLEGMKSGIERTPSSLINAASIIAKEFGELVSIDVKLQEQENAAEDVFLSNDKPETVTVIAQVNVSKKVLLVDQEILARSLIAKYPWLHQIENISESHSQTAQLKMSLQTLKKEAQ